MAGGTIRRRSHDGEEAGGYAPLAEINITPMVDVMLVLLIIFMVGAPLMTVGVPLQLPKTQAQKVAQPKTPVIVSLDRDGKVFLKDEAVAEETLTGRLAALARADRDQVVLVRGDRSIQYGRLMTVMGQVSAAGFSKVSLIAESAGGLLPRRP